LIPLFPGEYVALDNDYYFDASGPLRGQSGIAGTITLRMQPNSPIQKLQAAFGSAYQESFRVPREKEFGFQYLTGNRGSRMSVWTWSPFDVIVLSKRTGTFSGSTGWSFGSHDFPSTPLAEALTFEGFRVVEDWAPDDHISEINSITSGPAVPFQTVQRVLRFVTSEPFRLKIKRIQYRYPLQSGNDYEVRLAGLKEVATSEPLTAVVMKRLLDAKTEESFRAQLI
jgi:hypothetical protein